MERDQYPSYRCWPKSATREWNLGYSCAVVCCWPPSTQLSPHPLALRQAVRQPVAVSIRPMGGCNDIDVETSGRCPFGFSGQRPRRVRTASSEQKSLYSHRTTDSDRKSVV